jgi:hypothetical protein
MQQSRNRNAKVAGLHVGDPMAGSDGDNASYNRATCTAGNPAVVGATYAHCIDERIPAISGYGAWCATVGADARFAAREVAA